MLRLFLGILVFILLFLDVSAYAIQIQVDQEGNYRYTEASHTEPQAFTLAFLEQFLIVSTTTSQKELETQLEVRSLTTLAQWMKLKSFHQLTTGNLHEFKTTQIESLSNCSQKAMDPNLTSELSKLKENVSVITKECISSSNHVLTVPLVELIAKAADSNPQDTHFSKLEDLGRLLMKTHISPERIQFFEQAFRVLGQYQFDKPLVVREIIANALDSYYYDEKLQESLPVDQKKVEITTNKENYSVIVEDHGVGMSLDDLIYFLLTPSRSRNALMLRPEEGTTGVTGRFGQGFLSVLSLLKEPGDKIVIQTSKDTTEPFQLTLMLGEDGPTNGIPSIQAYLEPIQKKERGTRILLQSSVFHKNQANKPFINYISDDVVQKYFQFSERGRIYLNDKDIRSTVPVEREELNIPFEKKEHRVIVKKSKDKIKYGTGKLNVTINGVLIKEYKNEGAEIYHEVTLDFPADTTLTQDRNTLNFDDPRSKVIIKSLIEEAEKKNDIHLINSLYPLLTDEAFNLLPRLKLHISQPIAPGVRNLIGLESVENKTIAFIHPRLFEKVADNSLMNLSKLSAKFGAGNLFGARFSQPQPIIRISEQNVGSYKKSFVFLENTENLGDPMTLPVLNVILKERGRFLSIDPTIFSIENNLTSTKKEPLLHSEVDIQSKKGGEVENQKIFEEIKNKIRPLAVRLDIKEFKKEPYSDLEYDTVMKVIYREFIKKIPQFSLKNRDYLDLFEETVKNTLFSIILERDLLFLQDVNHISEQEQFKSLISDWIDFSQSYLNHPLFPNTIRDFRKNEIFSLLIMFSSPTFRSTQKSNEKKLDEILKKYNLPSSKKLMDLQLYYSSKEILDKIEKDPDYIALLENDKNPKEFPFGIPLGERLTSYHQMEKILKGLFDDIYQKEPVSLQLANDSAFQSVQSDLIQSLFSNITHRKRNSPQQKYQHVVQHYQACRRENIKHCFDIVTQHFPLLEEQKQQEPNKMSLLFLYLNHLYDDNPDTQEMKKYSSNGINELDARKWVEFLNQNILNQSFLDFNPADLRLVHLFYLQLSPLKLYDRVLSKAKDKPSLFQLQRNVLDVSKLLLDKLTHPKAFGKPVNRPALIEWLSKIKFESREDIQSVEMYYQELENRGLVTEETIDLIFPILFGGKVSFLSSKGAEVESPFPYRPLEEHPKLIEIMGSDTELNRKQIIGAIQQNPRDFVWVKELVKNSKEAGAKSLNLDVMQNEQKELIVQFKDDGIGVGLDKMHYFFIPRYSSKPKTSEDINFGWGFFTLFNIFNDVRVDSSPDGIHKNTIYLKKENGRILISERTEKVEPPGSFKKGTILTLKKKGEANALEPAYIRSHLVRAIGNVDLDVKFNGESLERLNEYSLKKKEPMIQRTVQYDPSLPPIQVGIFNHTKKGIYYNGLFHSEEMASYFKDMPEEFRKLLSEMPGSLAINLIGNLAQNATRTGFQDQIRFQSQVEDAIIEGGLHLVAQETASNPHLLKSRLPYDFFYRFNFRDRNIELSKEAISSTHLSEKQILEKLNTGELLAGYVATIPISKDSGSLSLIEIKDRVRKFLQKENVLDPYGNYVPTSSLSRERLTRELSDPKIFPIIQEFAYQIENQLAVMKKLTEPGKSDSIQINQTYSDFSTDHIPTELVSLSPHLKKMEKFLVHQAHYVLNEPIQVLFYAKNDGSSAHDQQGSTQLGFNLLGIPFGAFMYMEENKKFDLESYIEIMNTLTHELVHRHEEKGAPTHDSVFFEKQKRYLEMLLKLNRDPVYLKKLQDFFEKNIPI